MTCVTSDRLGCFGPVSQHLGHLLGVTLPHAPLLPLTILLQTPLWGWHSSLSHFTDGEGDPPRR